MLSLNLNSIDKVAWSVEAVNAQTGLKILNSEPEGTDYVLNTAGWKHGLYVVRVLINGEPVTAEKIRVK